MVVHFMWLRLLLSTISLQPKPPDPEFSVQCQTSVMLSNIKTVSSFLWKDHKYLKIVFILLTGFVLFEELVVFFIDKPTLTTVIKAEMGPENFPQVLVCPDPAADLSILVPRGYQDGYHYQLGITGNDSHYDFFLWSGNRSESVEEIAANISILRTEDDCPQMVVWWNDNDVLGYEEVNTTISRALFPNHRCCKVETSHNIKTKVIKGLEIRYSEEKYKNKLLESWKMLLFDQKTYSVFQQNSKTIFGDSITVTLGSQGTNYYKIKIKQEVYLEDDPQYPCIDWQVAGEYDSCLEEEKVSQVSHILNCTPPWLTDNRQLWCGESRAGNNESTERVYFIFEDILMGQSDSSKCSIPCTKTNFYVSKIGFDKKEGREGLALLFDNVLEKRISELKIGPKTLLTRVGGIIGVGKNLLWLIVFLFTSLGSGLSLVGSKCNKETSPSQAQSSATHLPKTGM